MATSKDDVQAKITTLRQEILNYKPGKAVPSSDERVACLYPNKLLIYMIDVTGYSEQPQIGVGLHGALSGILPHYFGCALGKERKPSVSSSEFTCDDTKIHLTDYITFQTHHHVPGEDTDSKFKVEELSEMVGCFVVAIRESGTALSQNLFSDWITPIRETTGRSPIVFILCDLGKMFVERTRTELANAGITDIYEMPESPPSAHEQIGLLTMLQQCLVVGDEGVIQRFTQTLEKMCKDQTYRKIYENALNRQKRWEEKGPDGISDLEGRLKDKKTSANAQLKQDLSAKDEDISTLTAIVQKTMKNVQIAEERAKQLKKGKEEERAELQKEITNLQKRHADEMRSKEAQWMKTLDEKREAAVREIDLKNKIEQLRSKNKEKNLKHNDEKLSLEAEWKIKVESLEGDVRHLKKTIEEKEQIAATTREQQHSLKLRLKKEIESNKKLVEQLEREIWKLRTKIQLESEIRSQAEKERRKENISSLLQKFSVPRVITKYTSNDGGASVQESSGDTPVTCDRIQTSQAKSKDHKDEFASILKNIADDLYDDTKIDSLGGQLGILQGDIQRAIKTNMRFQHITSEGTHRMLQTWREGVSRDNEGRELRRALQAAKLLHIADRYVPEVKEHNPDHVQMEGPLSFTASSHGVGSSNQDIQIKEKEGCTAYEEVIKPVDAHQEKYEDPDGHAEDTPEDDTHPTDQIKHLNAQQEDQISSVDLEEVGIPKVEETCFSTDARGGDFHSVTDTRKHDSGMDDLMREEELIEKDGKHEIITSEDGNGIGRDVIVRPEREFKTASAPEGCDHVCRVEESDQESDIPLSKEPSDKESCEDNVNSPVTPSSSETPKPLCTFCICF